MTYNQVVKSFGGKAFLNKKTMQVYVPYTVYGALIENFEGDKYDIQMTCIGIEDLKKVLEILSQTSNVYDK